MKEVLEKIVAFLNPVNVEGIANKVGTALTVLGAAAAGLLSLIGG